MIESTLCYIEKENQYLMMLRNRKSADPNSGKWIGVGGKIEPGETPEECLVREVREETGLELVSFALRGVILFFSDLWEDERMYLYTADSFAGELAADCDEGELHWVPKEEILNLNLWEGDRIFLRKLLEGEREINLSLYYEKDKLARWSSFDQ